MFKNLYTAPRLAFISSFLVSGFVLTMLYQSLFAILPISATNDRATVTRENGFIKISYYRTLVIVDNFDGSVSRFIVHDGSREMLVLANSDDKYQKGRYEIMRSFYLPASLKPGRWCLHANLKWKPILAVSYRLYEATPVCFIVDEVQP